MVRTVGKEATMDCSALTLLAGKLHDNETSKVTVNLELFQLQGAYFAVGWTSRVCCAQVMGFGEPTLVWSSNVEEKIRCCAVISKNTSASLDDEEVDSSDDDDSVVEETSGVSSVCVAIGTDKSRVLAIEITLSTLENDKVWDWTVKENPFEPLPFILPQKRVSISNEEGNPEENHIGISTNAKRNNYDDFKGESSSSSSKYSSKGTTNETQFEGENISEKQDKMTPFYPQGGVFSITPFHKNTKLHNDHLMHVWVAYNDGTAVQILDRDFFPSSNFSNYTKNRSCHNNSRVSIPILPGKQGSVNIYPLPKVHTSFLAPLDPFVLLQHRAEYSNNHDDSTTHTSKTSRSSKTNNNPENKHPPVFQALTFGEMKSSNDSNNTSNSLSLYSSEDHSDRGPVHDQSDGDDIYELVRDNLIDGTKFLMNSMIGTAMKISDRLGKFSSRNVKGDTSKDNTKNIVGEAQRMNAIDDDDNINNINGTFLTKNPPHMLPLCNDSFLIDSPPRKLTSISIDPGGNLAATCDTLGRVILMDLRDTQTLRMWKGLRDSTCHWMQVKLPSSSRVLTYLVIHSRQRTLIEVYRMRHGPRVMHMLLPGNDARVVQSRDNETGLATCFLLSDNMMEMIVLPPENTHNQNQLKPSVSIQKRNCDNNAPTSRQLQLLQQILASDTKVPSNQNVVFHAMTMIPHLSDLSKALDLLSVASHLETGMGVQGSTFHTRVLDYVKDRLKAVDEEGSNNATVQELRKRIQFHSQVLHAYNILYDFENANKNRQKTQKHEDEGEDEDEEDLGKKDVPMQDHRSPWAQEAIQWVETHNNIVIDDEFADKDIHSPLPALTLSSFAKACSTHQQATASSSSVKKRSGKRSSAFSSIRFCDSTKDRKVVLKHIFQPFLQDMFVYKVVNSIFESMGLLHEKNDLELLQQYFAEWFMTVSTKKVASISLFGEWCPVLRWLQEIVVKISSMSIEKQKGSESDVRKVCLQTLYDFCSQSSQLPHAFILAAVCREAVSFVYKQEEGKTYGKVSSEDAVRPWDILLRKLRICLLVSLHLEDGNKRQFPLNPQNVESGNIFSVYEWLALDELNMISHKQDEIAKVELSCKDLIENSKSNDFNLFHKENDAEIKWRLAQSSCRIAAQRRNFNNGNDECKTFDLVKEKGGPLLLYLSNHNNSHKLAAHRALILAVQWGRTPSDLQILKNCVSALYALTSENNSGFDRIIASAVRMEVWQVQVRPIFRALLYGFEDVHELSEEIINPLCMDENWLRDFAKSALQILNLIELTPTVKLDATESECDDTVTVEPEDAGEVSLQWPKLRNDFLLDDLISKSHNANLNILDTQKAIVNATLLVVDDLDALDLCVPEVSDLFLQNSLISKESPVHAVDADNQMNFLNLVIKRKAESITGPIINNFDLGGIENLARTWGFSLGVINSKFILALYEVEKDVAADDVMISRAGHIDVNVFMDGAFVIVCTRLHSIISILKKTKQLRGIISTLDADTCEWIKDKAEKVKSKKNTSQIVTSLSSTHELILKILQMSSKHSDSISTQKSHSLSVLTGTLINEMKSKN